MDGITIKKGGIEIQAEAPAEIQVQRILEEITGINEKLDLAKAVLGEYKIKSDRLAELKRAQKEIREQVNEEKERIESEHYENKDFETAMNDRLTLKNQLKEKYAQLRVVARAKYRPPELQTEDLNVKGNQMRLQLEFNPTVYLNGKELK